MRGDHFNALIRKSLVQFIALVCMVCDEVLRRRLNQVRVSTKLTQRDVVTTRCTGARTDSQEA